MHWNNKDTKKRPATRAPRSKTLSDCPIWILSCTSCDKFHINSSKNLLKNHWRNFCTNSWQFIKQSLKEFMEWSVEESLEIIQKKFLEKALEKMQWRIWKKKSGVTFGIVAYKSLKVLWSHWFYHQDSVQTDMEKGPR